MSRQDPRLVWTLLLRPPTPPVDGVRWPGLLRRLTPDLEPPVQDPLQAVVDGAFGRRVLRRAPLDGDAGLIISGLGELVGVSVSVAQLGEIEEGDPSAGLREAALAALGLTQAMGGDDDALAEALASDAGPWTLDGLIEVSAELLMGVPNELDEDLPAAEVGLVQIVRGGGVGQGHVAWALTGTFGRDSERPVAQRGVLALAEGHKGRVPATVAYGAAAVRFGAALSRAQRQIAALEGLVPLVRAACSWATARGPWPGPGDRPDYAALAARVELLKVGLRESHESLCEAQRPLLTAATRALVGAAPPDGGPFVEAAGRGSEAVARVAAREASVARWAGALALARDAAD
jgi:hypothetical protein